MKYIVAVFLSIMLFYFLTFARYNWKNDNRIAAIGSAIMGCVAFGTSIFLLFFGGYEM